MFKQKSLTLAATFVFAITTCASAVTANHNATTNPTTQVAVTTTMDGASAFAATAPQTLGTTEVALKEVSVLKANPATSSAPIDVAFNGATWTDGNVGTTPAAGTANVTNFLQSSLKVDNANPAVARNGVTNWTGAANGTKSFTRFGTNDSPPGAVNVAMVANPLWNSPGGTTPPNLNGEVGAK